MSVSAEWVYLQNECIHGISVYTKWVYSQNECNHKMSLFTEWVYSQNECISKMSVFTEWVYSQNECNCRMSVAMCYVCRSSCSPGSTLSGKHKHSDRRGHSDTDHRHYGHGRMKSQEQHYSDSESISQRRPPTGPVYTPPQSQYATPSKWLLYLPHQVSDCCTYLTK